MEIPIKSNFNIPVVAMTSKPTKPKKQVAAPRIIPANPYGANPPTPQESFSFSIFPGMFFGWLHMEALWISSSLNLQLLKSAKLNKKKNNKEVIASYNVITFFLFK